MLRAVFRWCLEGAGQCRPRKEIIVRGYSIREVAGLIGVAVSTFYVMIGRGSAPPVTKIGKRSIVFERDYMLWLDKQPKR